MSDPFKRRQGFTKKAAKVGPDTWARTPSARARIHRAAKKHAKQVDDREARRLYADSSSTKRA